jgi:hypothetical protein
MRPLKGREIWIIIATFAHRKKISKEQKAHFYKKMTIMNKEEQKLIPGKVEIPVEGALGLLALGSKGLRAWRQVRDAAIAEAGKENEKEEYKQGSKGGAK